MGGGVEALFALLMPIINSLCSGLSAHILPPATASLMHQITALILPPCLPSFLLLLLQGDTASMMSFHDVLDTCLYGREGTYINAEWKGHDFGLKDIQDSIEFFYGKWSGGGGLMVYWSPCEVYVLKLFALNLPYYCYHCSFHLYY